MAKPRSTAAARTLLMLAGRPSRREFVRQVKAKAIDGFRLDDLALDDEWKKANARVRQIEMDEHGMADVTDLQKLPASIASEAEVELSQPRLKRAYGLLPYSWALVELDRLIAWQNYVDLSFATALAETLPAKPSMSELLGFATGRGREPPPVHVTVRNGNNFAFCSTSSDLRVIGTVPLDPDHLAGHETRGHVAAVIGVLIGYSTNVMTAVHAANRLVLTNGTHRAYALRSLGISHAPCIVRHVASKEELELVGALPNGSRTFDWHLTTVRPPLLRDFFDQRLIKAVPALPDTHLLELEMKFEQSVVPAV